jgi:hypothetical protein
VHAHLLNKAIGPAHRWTESNAAQQVVDNPMARTVAPVGDDVSLRIKRLNVVAHAGILEVQGPAGEGFVEEPSPATE